jgi:uncharacterized RDD family membrane protein YckC
MPSPLAYPELLQPLSPGNIVSAGIRLYRAHFKEYSGVAVTTVAWIGVLLILAVPIAFLFYAVLPVGLATLLAVPLGFVLSFYCFGRYLAGGAAISRLVFKELMLEPETAKAAKTYANSRTWGFWLLSLVLFIIFFGVIMAMYIALAIAIALLIASIGGLSAIENNSFEWLERLVRNPAIAVAFVLGCLAVVVTFTIVWTWISARFAVAELPYGIEPDVGATGSIGRSWALTETNVWHTVMVVFVTGLIMIPISVMIQIASSTVQVFFSVLAASENPILLALFYLASLVLALLGTIVTLPLSQAIKGVLYLDLRNRREGLKLHLRSDEPVDRIPQDTIPQDTTPQAPVQPPVELFRKVKVLTPESVELEFTLAGIGSRGLALLIDTLLVILGIAFFWFFGSLFATQLFLSISPSGYGMAAAWLLGIAFLVTFLISAGYFVVFETLRQGQTPGKRYAQIRVIRDDGRPVGLTQSVLRALLRPLDDFLFWVVGTALILFDQNEKRLGDLVAGTLVIQEERSAIKRKIDLSESAQGLARQLSTVSDMTQLLPDDFAVVREFLQRREFMTPRARTDLSMNLARQARTLVKLETIPAGVTSDQFLEAVYLAYQSN